MISMGTGKRREAQANLILLLNLWRAESVNNIHEGN